MLAHKYINRFCSLEETDAKVLKTYSLLRVILDSMEELSHLLKSTVKVTERDYSYSIWLSLLRKLFSISGNLIRLKSGEFALSHSTTEKQDIYSEEKGVVGFKIDLRCIFDHGYTLLLLLSFLKKLLWLFPFIFQLNQACYQLISNLASVKLLIFSS